MDARDIMTSPVVTSGPDTTIPEIVQQMLDHRISTVPIVDPEGAIIGLVSEDDLMRRTKMGAGRHPSWWLSAFRGAASLAEDFVKSHGIRASEIMTKNAVTINEDTPLWQIVETFEKKKIKCLPVVRDTRVVGILSRANVLQGLTAQRDRAAGAPSRSDRQTRHKLADMLKGILSHANPLQGSAGKGSTAAGTPTKEDRAIRQELIDMLKGEKWLNMAHLNIVVVDGTVHFWGLVNADTQRAALRAAAESVVGVDEIVDHTVNAAAAAGSV